MISGLIVLPVEQRNRCSVLLRRGGAKASGESGSILCKSAALGKLLGERDGQPEKARRCVHIDERPQAFPKLSV